MECGDNLFIEESVGEEWDEDVSRSEHQALLGSLLNDCQTRRPLWKATRTESRSNIDDFGLNRSGSTQLPITTLLNLSKNNQAKQSLRGFVKKAVFPKPAKKSVLEKISRIVNFKEVSREISKYDLVVKELRKAEQLDFSVPVEKKTIELTSKQPTSEIEKEIMQQLSEGNLETNEHCLTERELEILNSVNLDEACKLHKEIQKRRTLISYQEAKYRRLRKIKSKKYHRLMKKDKLRKTVAEFETLVTENPEKAGEKLEELDRLRALERASLKHRSTGKWAKHNRLRAKFDDKARDELDQQLRISEELVKKRSLQLPDPVSTSEITVNCEKHEEIGESELILVPASYNPWLSVQPRVKVKVDVPVPNDSLETSDADNKQFFQKRIQQRMESAQEDEVRERVRRDEVDEKILIESVDPIDLPDLSAKHVITAHKITNLSMDDGEKELDFTDIDLNQGETKQYLRDIFADTDVVDEFMKEQKRLKEPVMGKSSYLPGWGQWAGDGIKESRKRKAQVARRHGSREKRHKEEVCNAIVLDAYRDPCSKYQVHYQPLECNNLQAFERGLLRPIGSTWTPETVSQSLRAPSVVTTSGAIIEPMKPLQETLN